MSVSRKGSKDTRMANGFRRFDHFDTFCYSRVSPVMPGSFLLSMPDYQLLIRNLPIRAQEPGMRPTVKRDESARSNLEGGLTTVSEGLEGFRLPCTKVLSVAGLLAFPGSFLAGRRFILRVEREVLHPEEPLLFNP